MNLAKSNHPDYGGDVEQFRIINEAYCDMKKQYHSDKVQREVKLVTEPVLSDTFILGADSNENWIRKRRRFFRKDQTSVQNWTPPPKYFFQMMSFISF